MKSMSSFALQPPDPYRFRKRWQRVLIGLVDGLGGVIFGRSSFRIQWKSIGKIAVLRLDGLGDVVLTAPFFETLKKSYPHLKIDLWVGPWAGMAATIIDGVDSVKIFTSSDWTRPHNRPWSWKTIWKLGQCLKNEKYDMVIDLRGDLRHLIAMWLSKAPVRVGQILTGGKFLLTHPIRYDSGIHVLEQNLFLLSQLGADFDFREVRRPDLRTNEKTLESVSAKCRFAGIGEKIIALHPVCEVPARKWLKENWVELAERLNPEFDVVLLGGESDKEELEEIRGKTKRKTIVASGLFTIPELSVFLKKCVLFIGVNSSPGHVAALVGTPVVSLFSGTEPPERWKPYGERVSVIHKPTECWPCDLSVCPFNNECMKLIDVQEVLTVANRIGALEKL